MAVSFDQFSKQLADSGVMTDSDLRAFIETLPADSRPTDGEQLAKRLVREKKISAYQAQVVYSGKGKSLTLGSYSVIDKLGQGGMGMVLKAEHRVMKRMVALKVLSPAVTKTKDAVLRFQREVEAAARLSHPNIVAAFDAGEANGTSFLVMEYVPGNDLASLVKDKGPLPVHQAIDCIIQAARGLEFAHAHGVIHRDIKPANLLLDTSGSVKILDMGLARIQAGDAATQAELTGTGAVMGTVDYMAPEQAVSTKHADARSDIYSLGISLWYLLTGKSTYDGDSLMARLLAHRDQPIPSLHKARVEVSEELEAVFRRMVAKKPAERYQTATEVIADLQACRTGGSVSAMMMVEEVASSVDDFKAFLQGLEGTVHSQGGVKSKASLTATQTLSKHSSSHFDETIPPPGTSDTLHSRLKRGGAQQSSPWFQDRRVLIGGGVTAALVVLAVVLLFQNPNGTLRVETLDPEGAVKGVGTGAEGVAQPPATAIATPTGPFVDLLAVIDPQRDPWTGEWRREEKFLLSDNDGKPGRVQIRYPVPDEYELTAVIERLDSDDGFQFGLVVGGRPVALVIDSFVPHITGLGLLDGKNPNDNVTTLHRSLLTNNRQYTVVITVGKRSVRATLDGTQILAWEGDPRRLDLAHYEQATDRTQLWIGTGYIPARFHKLELRTHGASVTKPAVVYLDDLQEAEWKDGHMRLGKHNLEYNGWKYTWRGKEPTHALSTHPLPNKTASVSYQLDGQYETFSALTGIADITETGSQNPLTFRVVGDGRELWKSPPLKKLTDEAAFSVSVKGINELRLEVNCGDESYKAHAVWFEPRLTRVESLPSTGTQQSLAELLTSSDYEWTIPENLGAEVNSQFFDEHPELTADDLRLWFSGGGEIWMSTRATRDVPFGPRVNAGNQINDGASWDSEPTLSADRLSLVLSSDRQSNKQNIDLWMCSRALIDQPFGRPVKLGNDVNSSDWETCPALSADGLTLLFSSTRSGGEGAADLYQATRASTSAEFGNVTNLGPVVNSPQRDSGTHLSSDGLVLLFESARRGGAGKSDLYLSTRPTRDATFGKPVSLGKSVNTSFDEQAPCLSADGHTLMFYSDRPGGQGQADLWMSRRVLK